MKSYISYWDCCLTLSDQKEEHISCWPDDNDVFFELDRYKRRKILVLFQRNKSSQNPCLKWDTLYWLQVNQSFVLFLYMILHAKQTFFVISVLLLQIQLSRRRRVVIPFFSLLPDTFLCQSQARNWISIDICCGLFPPIIWKEI